MKKNKGNDYFDIFEQMLDFSYQSASLLHETLTSFDLAELEARMGQIHDVEHQADVRKHEMMEQLAREFLPPIEREDIVLLAQVIDDVTDSIEDILLRIYMFDIRAIRPEALEFSEIIVNCCAALKTAAADFHNFKKSGKVSASVIEVNRLEETGDALYTRAMRGLYTSVKDPVELMTWTETINRFEKCCDACEHVANAMETVILKNS